jgi:hypothetical protein
MRPHYLRHDEEKIWDRYHTAALMGGSAPIEAARYADAGVESYYRRFEWHPGIEASEGVVGVPPGWMRNTRPTQS